MRVTKKTTIRCNICKGKWNLDKVVLENGEQRLRCFHCRPNLRIWTDYLAQDLICVEPYDEFKASFSSREEEFNMCEQISNELDAP